MDILGRKIFKIPLAFQMVWYPQHNVEILWKIDFCIIMFLSNLSMYFRDLLVEALMLMQDLWDCLLHVGWNSWSPSHTVKIWVFMQKGLEQSMLSAHQQMQQQGAVNKMSYVLFIFWSMGN